jgi:intergrase/recombinase
MKNDGSYIIVDCEVIKKACERTIERCMKAREDYCKEIIKYYMDKFNKSKIRRLFRSQELTFEQAENLLKNEQKTVIMA